METVSPEFLAACRRVLGDDNPRTVLIAIRDGDPRMSEVHARAGRDPRQWLCSAIDEDGISRLWAKGASEQEARYLAELAVTAERERKQSYHTMAPCNAWTFVTIAPDEVTAGQHERAIAMNADDQTSEDAMPKEPGGNFNRNE